VRNIKLFYTLETGLSLITGIILPVYVLYFRLFDITLFEVAILSAVFEATIIIFEIPTGRFADRYGRKLSTIIGFALYILAALVFLNYRDFTGFLIAEMIFGIGDTFISGALEALAVDSIPENERHDRLPALFARRTTFKTAAMLVGMLLGGMMAGVKLSLLFVPVMAVAGIGLGVSLFLVNIRTATSAKDDVPADVNFPIRSIFSGGIMTALFAVGLLSNFVYEPVDQFWQVLFSEIKNIGGEYFGLITAAGMILVVITASLSKKLYSKPGLYLFGAFILIAAGLLAAVKMDLYPALAGIIVYFAVKELIRPLISTHLNRHFKSANRATMLSAYNMICSIGEVAAAVLAGFLAANYGIKFLFVFSATGALALPVVYNAVKTAKS